MCCTLVYWIKLPPSPLWLWNEYISCGRSLSISWEGLDSHQSRPHVFKLQVRMPSPLVKLCFSVCICGVHRAHALETERGWVIVMLKLLAEFGSSLMLERASLLSLNVFVLIGFTQFQSWNNKNVFMLCWLGCVYINFIRNIQIRHDWRKYTVQKPCR